MHDSLHTALLILCMSGVTVFLRFLPFMCFSKKRPVPKYIAYLGEVLPPATLGMLVVYCFRDIKFYPCTQILCPLISAAVVVLTQKLRENTVLSVIAGTACYFVLSRIF